MKSKNFILRFFIYFLNTLRASLYTPTILSIAFFIAVLIIHFGNTPNKTWDNYSSGREFTQNSVLQIFGILSLVISVIVLIVEKVFNLDLHISQKKRIFVLETILIFGYIATCIYLIFQTGNVWANILVALVFLIFSSISLLMSLLVQKVIDLI